MNYDGNRKYFKKRAVGEVILTSFLTVLTGIILLGFTNLPDALPDRVIGGVAYTIQFIVIVFMVKFVSKTSFSNIGFIFKPVLKKCLSGLALAIGMLAFIAIIAGIFIILTDIQIEDILDGRGNVSLNIAILQTLYFYVFVAVAEESIFRGFIFHRLNQAFSSKMLVTMITSFLFMAAHYRTLSIAPAQAIETFVLSAIYCIFLYRSKDKSIFPLIIAHGFWDSFPILLGMFSH